MGLEEEINIEWEAPQGYSASVSGIPIDAQDIHDVKEILFEVFGKDGIQRRFSREEPESLFEWDEFPEILTGLALLRNIFGQELEDHLTIYKNENYLPGEIVPMASLLQHIPASRNYNVASFVRWETFFAASEIHHYSKFIEKYRRINHDGIEIEWRNLIDNIRTWAPYELDGRKIDDNARMINYLMKTSAEFRKEVKKQLKNKDVNDEQVAKTLDEIAVSKQAINRGNIKRSIYENDQETIQAVEALGVNFKPFMNLTDPDTVYAAVEKLRSEKKGSPLYQRINQVSVDKVGKKITELTPADVAIYSDELGIELDVPGMKKGNISFKFSTRDDEDIKIGDWCGDCSQKGGINENAPKTWQADVNTQIMRLYYDKKFMGRLNLVIVEATRKPTLLIDAIEFIPQARENEKYSQLAREAYKAGLEKTVEIAKAMNITQVATNTFSNSSEVGEITKELGYRETYRFGGIELIRGKPLTDETGEPLEYMLQSSNIGEEEDQRKVYLFEQYLNEYMADEEKASQVNGLLNKNNCGKAAEVIVADDHELKLDGIFPHLLTSALTDSFDNETDAFAEETEKKVLAVFECLTYLSGGPTVTETEGSLVKIL